MWAAQTKVSTKDLMARMGHDDMRAALLYQRATQEAADRIADGLTDQVEQHRRPPDTVDDEPDDGPAGALVLRAEGTQWARGETRSRNDEGPARRVRL